MANKAGGKNPAMTKRGRFNPNPTPVSHAGCIISAQAKRNKEASRNSPTKAIVFKSKAKSTCAV